MNINGVLLGWGLRYKLSSHNAVTCIKYIDKGIHHHCKQLLSHCCSNLSHSQLFSSNETWGTIKKQRGLQDYWKKNLANHSLRTLLFFPSWLYKNVRIIGSKKCCLISLMLSDTVMKWMFPVSWVQFYTCFFFKKIYW